MIHEENNNIVTDFLTAFLSLFQMEGIPSISMYICTKILIEIELFIKHNEK